jgi:hypothetical protein
MTQVLLALLFTLSVAAIDATFTPILEQATTPQPRDEQEPTP